MRFLRKDNFTVTGLAACILGLVICPFLYIAIGALFSFSPAFSLLMLPPLLVGSSFLLWRFLSGPTDQATSTMFIVTEGISWIAIVAFVILISRFKLLTAFERFGLFCTFFMLASICCLPLVLIRETALEQRLTQLPNGLSISALLIILMLSGFVIIIYFLSTPVFI